jgi:hypothetical protein
MGATCSAAGVTFVAVHFDGYGDNGGCNHVDGRIGRWLDLSLSVALAGLDVRQIGSFRRCSH